MRGRLTLVLATWAVLIPGVVGLIWEEEHLEPAEPIAAKEMERTVVINSLVYTAENRPTNFNLLGLGDPELFGLALKEMELLDAQKDEITKTLRASKGSFALGFCPGEVAVPYRAAEYLITQTTGAPQVRDQIDKTFGKPWLEYDRVVVNALYKKFEGYTERAPGDTLIALSALLIGEGRKAALEITPPFGVTTKDGGSFATIVSTFKQNKDVQFMMVQYLARVELIAEIVHADLVGFRCKEPNRDPERR
jgi:hypothetical protein